MSIRTRGLTVLTVTVALVLTGCGSTAPAARPAAADDAPVALAAPTPDGDGPPYDPAATAAATAPRHTPGPGGRPVTPVTPVMPVRPVAKGKSRLALATPDKKGGPAKATTPALALTSYDRGTGRAVLAPAKDASAPAADASAPAKAPSAPAADASAPAHHGDTSGTRIRPGQLIDSPPTPAAPRGALLAVTDVQPSDDGKTVVHTRPATLTELLGESSASLRTALDPRNIEVKPQVKDLKVSFTKGPDGGAGSASAGLRLDADTTVPLPHGASAKLDGSIELDPTLGFSYQGSALRPQQAGVGFDLGAHATWHVGAAITDPAQPIRIPLATLTASPVVMVGQLPVVIHLDLTLYATVDTDGKVTLDTEQRIDGSWGVHSAYTRSGGWHTDTRPGTLTVSPVKATLAGTASVRTGLDVEGSVALYDAVGLKATVSPYLRTAVEGQVTVDTSGAAPVVTGTAGLYGGLDIRGALMARIAVFGTPLFEKELPFPAYRHEWPLAAYGTPGGATAPPRPSGR
ncbi:hypothetical protein ACFYU9_21955 [Streptomyces sp. NPDC004327]|uniref:hypothetical protein n=1 Tax=Streptomyces sp. NPDC004327 TaxID=3364699 RepID=UPI00369F46BA